MSALRITYLLAKVLASVVIIFIGALIFLKSLEYYSPNFDQGYLLDKQQVFQGIFKYGLYAPIIAAPIVLLVGTFQVMFRYERHWVLLHRWLGVVYVLLVLVLAAPGGLVLSFYAMGGPMGMVGFGLLSMLWFIFTLQGWRYAKAKQYDLHRQYMLRSYVLTLSAVSLRLLGFLFVHYLDTKTEAAYLLIAWLSWLPQLVLLEIWLRLSLKKEKLIRV